VQSFSDGIWREVGLAEDDFLLDVKIRFGRKSGPVEDQVQITTEQTSSSEGQPTLMAITLQCPHVDASCRWGSGTKNDISPVSSRSLSCSCSQAFTLDR